MIFVTVGTHEQQFNRLVEKIDELVYDKIIADEVFMQIGYSTYEPKYTQWEKMISHEKMEEYEEMSEVIITHGGPATFMSVLRKGKIPIVVPRLEKFGEHVNDHQLDFVLKMKERGYHIIVIEEIGKLNMILRNFQQQKQASSINTKKFVKEFEVVISDLFKLS